MWRIRWSTTVKVCCTFRPTVYRNVSWNFSPCQSLGSLVPDTKKPKVSSLWRNNVHSTLDPLWNCGGSVWDPQKRNISLHSRGFSDEELRFSDSNVFRRMQRMAPRARSFFKIKLISLHSLTQKWLTKGRSTSTVTIRTYYYYYIMRGQGWTWTRFEARVHHLESHPSMPQHFQKCVTASETSKAKVRN